MIILSVDATPVNPSPLPTNVVAVTMPENVALPLLDIVAADPTSNPFAVTTPTKSESPVDVRVTPVPILTLLSLPSIVTDPVPIVKIPVILASPCTINAVVAVPVLTFTPFINEDKPTKVDTPAVTCKPSEPVCCIPLVAVTIPVE